MSKVRSDGGEVAKILHLEHSEIGQHAYPLRYLQGSRKMGLVKFERGSGALW